MKLVLNHLVHVERLFTLEWLNQQISDFAYGSSDRKNRPSSIPMLSDVLTNHSLKQKAFQFFCLFRLLPFLIGGYVPIGHPYWAFYLELRDIGDHLFSQKWTSNTAAYFSVLYEQHMRNFRRLFPNARLIPKHHMLMHYALFAMRTGPPYYNMVSCQEMKLNFFRRLSHGICCFKNLPMSLAFRHQFGLQTKIMSGKVFKNNVSVLSGYECSAGELYCVDECLGFLQVTEDNLVYVMTKFLVCGQLYVKGQVLPLFMNDIGMPIFGQLVYGIQSITADHDVSVIVQLLAPINFDTHFWCFLVNVTTEYKLIRLKSLLDYHPLDLYPSGIPNQRYVSHRYLLGL